MCIRDRMYAQAQQEGEAAADDSTSTDDNVVDAEFEEVDDTDSESDKNA